VTVQDGRYAAGGSDRLVIGDVSYGDVLGDKDDEAVVTITCVSTGMSHAALYTVDPAAPAGVRRLALVEPDQATLLAIEQQGIASWRLARVVIERRSVVSDWSGFRPQDGSTYPGWSFSVRQRWTGSGWEKVDLVFAPVQGR
jgi:hypothetical protein